MNKNNHMKSSKAFTLIELLVVTTIIIILSAIGLATYRRASRNARNGRRKADLETVRQALMLYKSENGCFPNDSSFTDMMSTISDYISESGLVDPKNSSPYTYSYSHTGTCGGGTGAIDFTLEANLEASEATPTPYQITSP